MIEIKYKIILPFVAVAITVFSAVSSAFVCYGIFDAENDATSNKTVVGDFIHKNIFISVQNSETNTLDSNVIASFDPKDNTIKLITIPAETRVKVATSDQMFKDVTNIGGVDMLRNVLDDIVPLTIDYHLIIKTSDLYSGDLSYSAAVRYILSEGLWQQGNLSEYLKQILSVSSTDLTLLKTDEYANFINRFSKHTNQYYTVSGTHFAIADRVFYMPDVNKVNELINTEILN